MPLVVAQHTTPPPPPPPPGARRKPAGLPQWVWVGIDGTEMLLSDGRDTTGRLVTRDVAGWGATPVSIVADQVAGGGEHPREVRAEPARVQVPVHVWGPTTMIFQERWWRLVESVTNTAHRRRPGLLRRVFADGSARETEAWYEDGLGGEPGQGVLSATPVITFYCPDGYWRDVHPQVVSRAYDTGGNPFLAPFLSVSDSAVLGETRIHNPGQVEAHPNWRITGPCARFEATNHTLGASFALTHALSAGQEITITITRTRPLIRGPGGINLVGALDWPSAVLWPLAPGVNDIDFQVDGAGPGTAVELVFYPRYGAA